MSEPRDRDKDRQSRATAPPIPREDDPPMAPAFRRRDAPTGEPIARVALRAPKAAPLPSEHEEVMRALASLGTARAQLEEQLQAQQASFEERLQESLRGLVIEEIPRHASLPPPARPSERTAAGSWFAHIPATLMGLAALVGVIAQSCQKKAEVSADVLAKIDGVNTALVSHIAVSDQRSLDYKKKEGQTYSYLVEQRNWLADVSERLGVKVDDPSGTPSHQKMEFYAPPLVGSKAPPIQPKATFPYPP
jgi:hypothetical protein